MPIRATRGAVIFLPLPLPRGCPSLGRLGNRMEAFDQAVDTHRQRLMGHRYVTTTAEFYLDAGEDLAAKVRAVFGRAG